MDKTLRALYRRFRSSGATDDGTAFLQAAIRAGYPVETEELDHQILRGIHNTLVDSQNFLQNGVSFYNLFTTAWMPLIRRPHPHGTNMEHPIYGIWCRAHSRPNEGDVNYQVSIFTVSWAERPCLYCDTVGPHHCEDFVHPDEDGLTIPYQTIEGMDPNDERGVDPVISRVWHPTQETREMGTVYDYTIRRYTFSQPAPEDAISGAYLSSREWYLTNSVEILRFTDKMNSTGLATLIKNASSRSVPRGFRVVCLTFYNQLSDVPSVDTHEPLETAPTLLTDPCEDFIKIPGGRVLQELDYDTGRVRIVSDTTTICGHGYTESGHLCPPTWSDTGEQAGWRCNICRKLLGLKGGREGYTVRCDRCDHAPDREDVADLEEDEYDSADYDAEELEDYDGEGDSDNE